MSDDIKTDEKDDKTKDLENDFFEWREKNPNSALFLPPNSVRAIVVIWLLIIISIMSYHGSVESQSLLQMLSMALGFYFGSRANTTPKDGG